MTAEPAPGTALDQLVENALIWFEKKPTASLDDLAAELVPVPEPEPLAEAAPFPPVPDQKDLTELERKALQQLPSVFAKVRVTKRRELTATEASTLMDELMVIGVIGKMAAARSEDIKELARHSMDVRAERTGQAFPADTAEHRATPRDQHGHYLLAALQRPERLNAGDLEFSQEYRSGKVLPEGPALERLHYQEGTVSRSEYLAFTEEKRVFSYDKAMRFIRRNPRRGLEILKSITRRSAPGSSLTVRKAK